MKTLARILLGVAAAVAANVHAEVFPLSGGDLSSAEDWGGVLPGEASTVVISNGTYTATENVKFGCLEHMYGTPNGVNNMIIDLTGNRDVKLSFAGFRPGASVKSPAQTNWFKGGWIDFQTKDVRFDKNFAGAWANGNNQRLAITDSAIVTNISSIVLYGSGSTGSGLLVDGSRLYCEKSMVLSGYGQYSGSEICIRNGGLFHCAGRLILTDGVESAQRCDTAYFTTNHLIVAGEGSRFVGTGTPAVSTGGIGDYILVTEKGYFSGNVYFGSGNKYATDSLMRIEKNARADIDDIRLCESPVEGIVGSRLEIFDGALVSNGVAYVGTYLSKGETKGAAGCSLIVSNATFVTRRVAIGEGVSGSNNTFIVSGSRAVFDHVATSASQYTYFSGGQNCLFQIENGAEVEWRYQDGWSYNSSVSNCKVRITGGGVLKRTGGFHPGSDRNVNSAGNVIEVSDGGRLEVSRKLRITGDGCALVVSNATVSAAELIVGDEIPAGSITGNGLVLVAGATPRINVSGGSLTVKNKSCVRYDLSHEVFASSEYVPLEVDGSAIWNDGCALDVIVSDSAVTSALANDICSFVLLKAKSIDIPEATLAAARAKLPAGCRLVLKESSAFDLLKLVLPKGLSIIVR